jgi:thermostable 8-oxoguanine DNA glycosylase
MKGDESKAIGSVETDLIMIKKNLDRLFKRLRPDNEKSLIPEISFTLSTASHMLQEAINTLDRISNQFDR